MADAAALERALASAPIQPPVGPGQPQTITMPVTPIQQDAAPGPPPGYLPTYFPSNTASANASTITIGAGEERSGVDVQVQLVQASMIQGTIVNPASQTTAVQVWLQNQDPAAEQNTPSTRANPNGRFTFQTVAPGRYVVLAQTVPLPQSGPRLDGPAGAQAGPPRLSPSEVFWGRAEVSVEATSALDLSISLQPGRSISGSVVFDASTPPDLTQARVMVTLAVPAFNPMPVPSPPAQAPVGPDGRFSVTGVIPGKYTLRGSWGVQKSAIVGADDVLDFPLDFSGERDVTDVVITLTDRTNELSGVLTDASGKPTVDHTVVIASRDSRYWTPGARRILTARPGVDGRYTFRNIPAGDYLLAAVTDLEQGGQYDQEFLKSLLGASMTITLHDGARQTQDIRLAR
jgi:hypothetical protein